MALLQVGDQAPTFKGASLTGGEFTLDAVRGQKGVVITFSPDQIDPKQIGWAKTLYEKNRADIEMVSVSRKLPGVAMAKVALQSMGIKFPVLYDQKEEVFQLYGVDSPVVIYSVNREGVITNVTQVEPKAFNQAAVEEAVAKAK